MEGWEFILAGGAIFSHLDYSFTAGHEDGGFPYPPSQPGDCGLDSPPYDQDVALRVKALSKAKKAPGSEPQQ